MRIAAVGISESRDVGLTEEPHNSANMSSGATELNQLRERLFQECSRIGRRYGVCLPNGEPKLATTLAVVASSPNLCCIAEAFRDKTRKNIDPYYLTRHSIAVNLIVEALFDRLTALQYNVSVGTEVPVKFGRLDVLLEQTSHGVQLCYSEHKIGIEVKTGLSLDLAQIFRYILDVDVLILVRTRPRQVMAIRQEELLEPLSVLLSAWISRARRLQENDAPVCNQQRLVNNTTVGAFEDNLVLAMVGRSSESSSAILCST